jgi:membrane protein required for colicin V production
MNPLDWCLAILLTLSVLRAAMRGFFRECFSLAGLIVGFALACWNYHRVATHLAGLLTSPPLAQLAAFLLILAGIMIVAGLLGSLLRKTFSAIGLGFLDRLAGAAFGLIRGALLGLALLLALTAFLPTAPWLQTSSLAPYFLRADHAVSFVMPSELSARFDDGLDRLKHTTPGWIKLPLPTQTK